MPPLNYRYSDASRTARAIGDDLLALTGGYEHLLRPADTETSVLIELALVARARHLLRSGYHAADRGDDFSATILFRSLNESAMTLAWLEIDPALASLVLRLDELRMRLHHHREYARVERNQRRRARRRGDAVAPSPPGGSLGLLDRAAVRRFRSQQKLLRAEARAMSGAARRMKRLGVTQLDRVPSFYVRAMKSGNPWLYTAAYRFDSNSATHTTLLGLQQFVEQQGNTVAVRDVPQGPRPDPYIAGAVLMGAVAQLAAGRAGHPGTDSAALDALEARIRQLPRQD